MRFLPILPIAVFAVLSANGSSAAAQSAGPRCDARRVERDLRALIAPTLAASEIPGMSYALGGRAGVIFLGGVGVVDRGTNAPARGDTIYQIGSITKMFSGLAVARLAGEGRLSLGTPLREAWPNPDQVPDNPAGPRITLQHVAAHTAGLPRYPVTLQRADGDPILGFSRTQLHEGLARVEGRPLTPGVRWSYSNFGYGVLAEAVATLLHVPFETIVRDQVARPLNLADTVFALSPAQRARLATPYRDDDANVATVPWEMGALVAAGGLYSTVDDLARYARWELGGGPALGNRDTEIRQLARAPLHRFTTETYWSYGLGRFIVDRWIEGHDVIWHGGDVDGYAGALFIVPSAGLSFAYLANRGVGQPLGQFQERAMNAILRACAPASSTPAARQSPRTP